MPRRSCWSPAPCPEGASCCEPGRKPDIRPNGLKRSSSRDVWKGASAMACSLRRHRLQGRTTADLRSNWQAHQCVLLVLRGFCLSWTLEQRSRICGMHLRSAARESGRIRTCPETVSQPVQHTAGHMTRDLPDWRNASQLALLILSGCQHLGVDGCAGLGPLLPRACKTYCSCCAVQRLTCSTKCTLAVRFNFHNG